MAIINCPECGKEISDKAASCPNCGCPLKISEIPQTQQQGNKKKSNVGLDILIAILLFIIPFAPIGIIIMWATKHPKSTAARVLATFLFGVLFLFWAYSYGGTKESVKSQNKTEELAIEKDDIEATNEKTRQTYEEDTSREIQQPFELTSGTYVVGEDIKNGKYDIIAIEGGSNVFVYETYDDYTSDNGYPKQDYIMGTGEIREGYEFMYSEKISNIKLENGNVLDIHSGLTVQMVEK